MAGLLKDMSHHPYTARNGMEAWELFLAHEVHLVISQWALPRLSGLQLCKKVRSLRRIAFTYFMVLIERDETSYLRKIFEGGVDDCLIKPVNPLLLKARIRSCERANQAIEKCKELQDTLTASRNKLRIVFDSLPEEIVSVDRQGKIVSLNRSYVTNRDSSYSDLWQQEIQAETLYFMQKFHQSLFKTSLKSVLETGKPVVINDLLTQQGENQRRKQIQFLPVIDDQNRIIQVVIVARDTTE
jgi:YesN/AraC family two-component response regulator